MKISLEALKRYVDINVPVEELCDRMVMAGFEIEEMEKQGENIKNVVAAKILKITSHENSDHLQICQMDVGKNEPVQIVTGRTARTLLRASCAAQSQTECSAQAANCALPRRITRALLLTAYLF